MSYILQNIYCAQTKINGLKHYCLVLYLVTHSHIHDFILLGEISIFSEYALNRTLKEKTAFLYFFHKNVCISVKWLTNIHSISLLYMFYVEKINSYISDVGHSEIKIINHILNTSKSLPNTVCITRPDTNLVVTLKVVSLRSLIYSCRIYFLTSDFRHGNLAYFRSLFHLFI